MPTARFDKMEKKFEPAAPPARVGRKQRKQKAPNAASQVLGITPHIKCHLQLLKLKHVKDYLLMEEEFVNNQKDSNPNRKMSRKTDLKPMISEAHL